MKASAKKGSSHSKVIEHLSQHLADTYILYIKTQNFHWNVEDPRFYFLHKMLEEQYEQLAEAVDVIAERLRGLEVRSPGSMKEFLSLTILKEASGKYTGNQMIENLLHDHTLIINYLHGFITQANDQHDDGTSDLFIDRIREHEKTAWILRSHLK